MTIKLFLYLAILQFPALALTAPDLSLIERYGIAGVAIPVAVMLHRLNQRNISKIEKLYTERLKERDELIAALRSDIRELVEQLKKYRKEG